MVDITIDFPNAESANEEFAEKRDFVPSYPAHDTQAALLLAAVLLSNKVNLVWDWIRRGIYRLSDTKFRLKEMIWPMETDQLDVSNKFGESCHIALYGLPDCAIDVAGKKGQEFAEHEIQLMSERRAA
ncbi:hypothetical protein [Propionivibrio dicarboxylicus]|uniref:Uncharacterized protein n=1 Tax=Propionivibrio dicarboxylicus TaxID=83767 RepID=A0A1G8FVS9_9RHOO|nr:hypothetical protein [Propionivibrio dicarboxylicus]SDH86227.1 hypothetical protein SAMN05660652_02444 [Propionivibrio dicarboxylicus]